MIQLAALLAKPILGKLAPDAAKDKKEAIQTLLTGGSGDAWLPLARQQGTLEPRGQVSGRSEAVARGEVDHDGKPLGWVQFDWEAPQRVDDCTLNKVCWRFYRNGLICLELAAGKDESGLDMRDLVGHVIELRGRAGFLIGVWSAAFTVHRGIDRMTFHTTARDDHLPLDLHFSEIADVQDGIGFRI